MIRIIRSKFLEKVALETTETVVHKLSEWIGQKVEINVIVADIVPLKTVNQQIAVSDEHLTFYIEIGGSSGVSFIFLRENQAKQLIDILNKQKIGTTKKIDDIGMSALKETTNLISGVYINEFARITGKNIVYNPPVQLTHKKAKDLRIKISNKIKDEEVIMFQSGLDIVKSNISINLFIFLEKSLFRKNLEGV